MEKMADSVVVALSTASGEVFVAVPGREMVWTCLHTTHPGISVKRYTGFSPEQ